MSDELRTLDLPEEPLQTLSVSQRILGLRLLAYNKVVDSNYGPLLFEPGAFVEPDPKEVRLRMDHADPPTGNGLSYDVGDDGPFMEFKVSKTSRGDDQLTLANDGVSRGVSVGYRGRARIETRDGRKVQVYKPGSAYLEEVSTTWQPTFKEAGVMYVLSKDEKGDQAQMAENEKPANGADEKEQETETARVLSAHEQIASFGDSLDKALVRVTDAFSERIGKLEEHARSQFTVPGAPEEKAKATLGQWAQYALRALSGDRISSNDVQYLALEDVITSDNLGVVPDTFLQNEMIGVIDASRPFMSSTRRLPTPSSGLTMHVPVLEQRPTVGLQSEEKSEIDSTAIKVTTADFSAITIAGGIDISLQLLKLSDPSFLDLAVRLMAEAFALTSERYALQNLLGADVDDGNTLDPAAPGLGAAFVTAFGEIKRPPDTIWLSSAAVGAFIDAVSPVTGLPMYSSITANATAGGGISGSVSGLRAVHVPALGDLGADVIVGPSSGFAWAEAGTYTLQVDVPSRAGRDVALVGIDWFAPYYPAAFTVYTLST